MKLQDWIYEHILPTMGWAAINALTVTFRVESVGEDRVEALRKKGQRIVYVFWHGRQFLLVRYMSNRNICIMSSTSRDGRLQAHILKKFGYEIVYGSSSKTPIRALVGSIQKMRAGYAVAFAVDGPRGPFHKVKPGALFLAKKTDALIVPATFSAHPAIILKKTWDQYMLPKPFARAVVIFDKPFRPSSHVDETIIQKESVFLESALNRITEQADALVAQTPF